MSAISNPTFTTNICALHIKAISRSTPLQQETEAVHIVKPLWNKSLVWMGLWLSTFIPAYIFVAAVLLYTFLDQQSTCHT